MQRKRDHGEAADSQKSARDRIVAGAAVVTFAGAIAALRGIPWLAGATAGAAATVVFLHKRLWRIPPEVLPSAAVVHKRLWRIPPEVLPRAAVVLFAFLGGVVAVNIAHPVGSSAKSSSPIAGRTTTTLPLPGQIEMVTQVANITRQLGFRRAQIARPCDFLEYRTLLYNPGMRNLANVRIATSINTMTPYTRIIPTVTVYAPDANPNEESSQPTISLPTAETQAYVAGTTKLVNNAGVILRSSKIRTLADGITASGYGIPIGALDVGITEYVQFETHVSCKVQPPEP